MRAFSWPLILKTPQHVQSMAYKENIGELDVERLLAHWRWLCPQKLTLIDRNAFGDLFLRNEEERVLWLDVTVGTLSLIADCEANFLSLSKNQEKLDQWFAHSDEAAFAQRGLIPGPLHCIAFSIPLVFAEGGSPETAYIADIYDYIGFLGDMHRQIANLPDGAKVELKIKI